jgi:hypothetical protein
MVVHVCNPVLRRMRHVDYEFKASLGYTARPCLKILFFQLDRHPSILVIVINKLVQLLRIKKGRGLEGQVKEQQEEPTVTVMFRLIYLILGAERYYYCAHVTGKRLV